MRKAIYFVFCFFLGLTTGQAQEVGVLYGGESDLDACGGVGKVVGLNPSGDNYLSVRGSPNRNGTELDRLGPNRLVAMCDQRGSWVGIVYPHPNNPDMDCGTGTVVAVQQIYRGPCQPGWVFGKYIRLIAG